MTRETRRSNLLRRVAIGIAALVVVLVSVWQGADDLRASTYHPDESRWLNRAAHLTELDDPLSGYWADKYLIRGQPPMGSYIVAFGLLLQGRDLDTNGPWNFSYGGESTVAWNTIRGNLPETADLLAARRTSLAIGVLTALAVFAIVTILSHWVGGLVAGLFFAVHPLQVYLATLGVSDAAFTGFVAASTLAAIWLAKRPSWPKTFLLAVLLAMGASTKLSPLFLSVGLALVGLLILAAPLTRRWVRLHRLWERFGALEPSARRLGWMLLSLPFLTAALFVLSYPYLWADPVGRTQVMLDFRQHEMNNQRRIWPEAAVDSRWEGISLMWGMLEHRYSATGKVIAQVERVVGHDLLPQDPIGSVRPGIGEATEPGFDMPLMLLGMATFVAMAVRGGLRRPHFLALATLGGQALIIHVGMQIDFDRYYLPIVMAGAVSFGIGAGQFWVWAVGWVRRSEPRELPAPALATQPRPRPLREGRSAD